MLPEVGLGARKPERLMGHRTHAALGVYQYLEVGSDSKWFEVSLSPLKTLFIVMLVFFVVVVKSWSQSIVQASFKLRILLSAGFTGIHYHVV